MSRAWDVPDIDPDAPMAVNARRILAVRIGELWSYDPIMPLAERTSELHDARIAAKRLRYTLELFRPVFGEAGQAAIQEIKGLQEDLGTLHDADVRIALVEDAIATLSGAAVASAPDVGATGVVGNEQTVTANGTSDGTSSTDSARGLEALLARERIDRAKRHAAVARRWARLGRDGFRADLVALSAMPLGRSSARSS